MTDYLCLVPVRLSSSVRISQGKEPKGTLWVEVEEEDEPEELKMGSYMLAKLQVFPSSSCVPSVFVPGPCTLRSEAWVGIAAKLETI